MIRRLRRRFIRIATLSVTAVMLLLTVLLNTANYVSTTRELRDMLQLISSNQGTIPAYHPVGEAPAAPPKAPRPPRDGSFTAETPYSTRYFVLRYQDDGTLVQADLANIASVTEKDITPYLSAAVAHGAGYGSYGSYRYYVTRTGDGRNMAVFLDGYQQLRSVGLVLLWSLVADAACILLVFVLVVLLSRRAIDPVVRSAEKQKQFITDASHELKTPITVISTCLRVLEMETGKQKWIDKAQAQTEKLTALVNALVTLSRMDEGVSPLKMEPFPLSEAVADTAEPFRDLAQSKGHTLVLEIAPELTYKGDEYAIRQLVSILLDNAVKYARADSPITLTLEKTRRGIALRCRNGSDPIPEDTLAKLFDRFYRADPSRNAATGGFGIGLSIARSIAEAHRGSIYARMVGEEVEFAAELR
mgnify:CR=1 FL=1